MNLLMASSAETIPRPRLIGLPLVSRASTRWIVRAPESAQGDGQSPTPTPTGGGSSLKDFGR
jgi:hypothetical protein